MDIRPFDISHFDAMELQDNGWLKREERARYAWLQESGVSYTLFLDGLPIYCGGLAESWPGVCDIWMLPSVDVIHKPISVVKAARWMLDDAIEKMLPHRIQATVKAADDRAVRFIEALGFEREGLMRAFSSDKTDFFLYARIS